MHKVKFLLKILRIPRLIIKGTRLQDNFFVIFIYRAIMRISSLGKIDTQVKFRGISFVAEGGDITILPTLLDESFEASEIEWLLGYLSKCNGGLLFIDVGANIGIYSALVLQNYFPARVIAIEPDSRNFRRLTSNLNPLKQNNELELVKCAIGQSLESEFQGNPRKFLENVNGGTSRFVGTNEKILEAHIQDVPVCSLESFLEIGELQNFVNIIVKVDVEGFEPEVLMSGINSIRKLCPTILIEFTNSPERTRLSPWTDDLILALFETYSSVQMFSKGKVKKINNLQDLRLIPSRDVVNLLFHNKKLSVS